MITVGRSGGTGLPTRSTMMLPDFSAMSDMILRALEALEEIANQLRRIADALDRGD